MLKTVLLIWPRHSGGLATRMTEVLLSLELEGEGGVFLKTG